MHITTNFKIQIPYLYEQQYKQTPTVYARYVVSNSDWQWLILEYSKHQQLFYGVIMPEQEHTYFTIQDLEKVVREYGVDIELDDKFQPRLLKELTCKHLNY
jgi:hypothetical protein